MISETGIKVTLSSVKVAPENIHLAIAVHAYILQFIDNILRHVWNRDSVRPG